MSGDLKPCPFCGASAELKEDARHNFYVKCIHCGARTKFCNENENENGAVMIWNSRPFEQVRLCRDCRYYSKLVYNQMHRCSRTSRLTCSIDWCSRFETREQEAGDAES